MKNKFLTYFTIQILVIVIFAVTAVVCVAQVGSSRNPAEICVIMSKDLTEYNDAFEGFKEYLDENRVYYRIVYLRILGEESLTQEVVREVRRSAPDLILAVGTTAAATIGKEINDIPIVVSIVLTQYYNNGSYNNVTGVSLTVPPLIQFRAIKQVLPDMSSIGVLYNPNENDRLIRDAKSAARRLNLDLIDVGVNNAREVPRTAQNLFQFTDALWMVATNVLPLESRRDLINKGLRNNIPIAGYGEVTVKEGTLLSVSYSGFKQIGRQSGKIAVSVLRGTAPGAIRFQYPEEIVLYVNQRVADLLGVTIPERITGITEIVIR